MKTPTHKNQILPSRQLTNISRLTSKLTLLASLVMIFAALTTSQAADGSWNVDADGNWSTPGNWLGGIVASGAGSTAYFTNSLTAVHTVTLDSVRTNGNLLFDDSNAATTPGGWILSGSGLTLSNSAATPVITVNPINAVLGTTDATNDVVINSVITALQGFIKNGSGTLTLSAANTISNLVQLNAGIVFPLNAASISTGNRAVIFNGGGVRVVTGGPILAYTNQIQTTATIISSNGNYDAYNGPWNGSGTVLIHSTGRFTPGNGVATTFANFTGTIDLTDSTSANETRINLGSGSTPYNLSAITLNCGTNAGRFDFRPTTSPCRVLIGALLGGPTSRLQSSENAGGTSLFWEIGYLNTSTLFEGGLQNRNNAPDRVGNLVKVGNGKLTLSGTSSYTGSTTVSNGVLALTNAAALTGATNYITVLTGATFDVSGLTTPFALLAGQTLGGNGVVTGDVVTVAGRIAPGTSTAIGSLSCSNNVSMDGTSTTTTNLFKLGSGVNDQLLVAGNLTLNGIIALRVVPSGAIIPNGSYVLYQWRGVLTGDTNNFTIEYPAQAGTFLLSTNLVTKQIILQVTGVPSANNLVWRGDGAANAWNFSTLNWRNGGVASLFNNGDKATFDDTGSNNVPVDISTSVNPSGILFNATKPYVIGSTAAAGIVGSISLVKSNTGLLTVTSDNSYSSGTLIAGGTVQVGDGVNTSGTLGSGIITNNTRLAYNRPDAVIVAPVITGSGIVVQNGTNTLTLNSADTYTGGTTVSNGTVRLATYSSLGSGTVTLAGGTLEIVPSGSAAVGLSNNVNVVTDSTLQYDATGTFAAVVFGQITGNPVNTLTINHTLTSVDRLRLYGNFTNDAKLNLNGTGINLAPYHAAGEQVYNGAISGSGFLVHRGGGTTYLNGDNTYTGGTTNTNGRIGFGINSTSSGGSVISGPIGTGPLALANEAAGSGGNGTVFASGGARTVENPILYPLTNAFTFTIAGSSNLTLSGPLSLHGSTDGFGGVNRTVQVDNSALTTFAGIINDGGLICGITKTGTGTLALGAVNTYTGPTLIGAGTLLINGQIDVGAVTVTNGTLGGTGTILGAVTITSPGTLSPGASVGTLTINNNLTLNGNLLIEVKRSLSPAQSNDVTTVSGTLNNIGTGTLTVTNLDAAPLAVGNKFKVFNKAVVNGGAITVTGGGMNWNNNLAVDGSITAASTISSQPPLITSTVIGGGNILISGTNGTAGAPFNVRSSTNLITPRASWALETSGTFGAGGGFSVSIPVNTTTPAKFYLLQLP